MAVDYNKLASQEYDQTYNTKVQDLKNQLASKIVSLDGQKSGINNNYDTQVNNQNLNSLNSKNNFSDQMLNRGLGRSSVVTTGLGEMDQTNNRVVNTINGQRASDLNGIEAQKSTLQNNLSTTLNGMSSERLSAIQTLARQLQDRDFDKQMQQKEFALKQQAEANNQANALRSYNLQVAAAKASQKLAQSKLSASNAKASASAEAQNKSVLASIKNEIYDIQKGNGSYANYTDAQKRSQIEKEQYMLDSYFNDASYKSQASKIISDALAPYQAKDALAAQKAERTKSIAANNLYANSQSGKSSQNLLQKADAMIGQPGTSNWMWNPIMNALGGY